MPLKTISITLLDPLLKQIDSRAKALDLNRCQYVRRACREEIQRSKATINGQLNTKPTARRA